MIMDCVEKKSLSITLCAAMENFLTVIKSVCITKQYEGVVSINSGMRAIVEMLDRCREKSGAVYVIGNGGSATLAAHAVVDFINVNKMRAFSLAESAVVTCISNDYGYEHVYSKQLMSLIRKEDVLIAISSSGKSKNILNAVYAAGHVGAKIITLSGFSEDNLLRQVGDYNIWLNSNNYGQVEIGHALILHYITDQLHHFLLEKMA